MTMYQFDQITVGANIKAPPTKNAVLLQAQSDEKQNELKAKQAAKKHLVQEFGMNKGRRIYEQADRMQVEAETLEKKLSKAATCCYTLKYQNVLSKVELELTR